MTDTAEVYGLPVKTWDEATASYESVAPLVHTGPCRLKLSNVQVHEIDAQSQPLIELTSTVSFPVAADTVFPKNFTVKITASETDPALAGTEVRITGPHKQTYATARRYPCEEVL
jgi:hypothetical protein